MLSYRTIVPHTLELLRQLCQEPYLKDCRLVGGTALALQYGHRASVDLDFFGSFGNEGDQLFAVLQPYAEVRKLKDTPNIKIFFMDDVKVDFVNYSIYSWIDDAVEENGLRLASPKDIAAMKINAIEGRGSKKDFIDVYFLLQHYSFKEILDFYSQKYPNYSIYRALMSLTYFADADPKEMPTMFENVSWEEIKAYVKQQVAAFERSAH
ncbi:MAG: nucleotidyl transferase AbiEii/AbiGii toxin family protein [Bacteroidales bacterium]|nr:nucleotidyl transferase AbiEii/AbiGii toxin family protein [Bacteroidales bacterium]